MHGHRASARSRRLRRRRALAARRPSPTSCVVGSARDTHDAVTRRVHSVLRLGLGSAATPIETVHRGVAAAVYGGLGLALRKSSAGLDKLAATGVGPRLEDGARGRFVSSAVNGLIGDELLRDRPQLAIPMTVRAGGRDVRPTTDDLADAFPGATGRLVVFLHGLCENESYWNLHRERTGTTYGEALAGARLDPGLPPRQHRPPDPRERRRSSPRCCATWSTPGRSRSSGSRWSATRWAA